MLFYLILLMGNSIIGSQAIAEDSEEEQTASAEESVTGESLIIEFDNGSEILPEEFVSTKKNHRIQMIVGGQAKDGLAKQRTLPVSD